ncbi:MAG: GNAT family N-acetyltransferase [Actinomycetota bacterium]|nr:GNAT family N-acetyltransferase [Actinomycetota bacterium]
MLRTAPVRVLDDRDVEEARAVIDRDPVTNVFVASRVDAAGLDAWRLGAEMWGYPSGGRLQALCYAGANLVPVGASADAARAFADKARRQGRRCSSIVGPAEAVDVLWHHLHQPWGGAREVRERQPLMAISSPSRLAADPGVRRVRRTELDVVLPACIAMFTEEVGVSPLAGDGGALYRARVAELIGLGRAFARIEDGRVLFKAEIGAASTASCQIQGVWVDPELRGQGLGTTGTAAVVDESLRSIAPVVSLYVNDFNEAARAAYTKVGFAEVGTFMSVLF